jgi:hypothetical protein
MRLPSAAALFLLVSCAGYRAKESTPESRPPSKAKITQFYVSPSLVRPNERTLLCYGVEGAARIRLEPPVEEITPSLVRCLEVKATRNIRYRLIATGRDGADVSAETTLTVEPTGAALIQFFAASQTTAAKGQPVTICYGVKGAAKVTLSPNVHPARPAERACFTLAVDQATQLTLTAEDASGRQDSEKLTIRVE